jgi:1,2-diacylglycerol 3-alpha-glucosyltransferase
VSTATRVLLVSDSVLPRHDGIATSLRALTKLLDSFGFSVTLIGPDADAKYYPHANVISAPVLRNYRGYPLAWPSFRMLWCSIKGSDVVHVHTLGPLGTIGLIMAKVRGRPTAFSIHTDFDVYATHYPVIRVLASLLSRLANDRAKVGPLYSITRAAGAFADVLVLPTPRLAARLPRLPRNIPYFIVPNTVALDTSIGTANSCTADILYVGRMAPEKSISYLLRCFANCVIKLDGSRHLTLVGDGPELKRLKHYAVQLGLGDSHIKWLGEMDNDAILHLMSSSRVLALPSLSEVDPMVLAEAAAVGLPAVVRDSRLLGSQPASYVIHAESCESFGEALAAASRGDQNPSIAYSPGETIQWFDVYQMLIRLSA